jgi:hypothetical protein
MVEAVIEFMTTYHDNGRHSAYGWVYVLAFVFPLFGALAARELRARKNRLLASANTQAASGPLKAVAVIEQAGPSRRVEGEFRAVVGSYVLSLRETVGDTYSESTHIFATIEQLEIFLESNTLLRLGDFKAG